MNTYAWRMIWKLYELSHRNPGNLAYERMARLTLRNYARVLILGESWCGKRIAMRRFGQCESAE